MGVENKQEATALKLVPVEVKLQEYDNYLN